MKEVKSICYITRNRESKLPCHFLLFQSIINALVKRDHVFIIIYQTIKTRGFRECFQRQKTFVLEYLSKKRNEPSEYQRKSLQHKKKDFIAHQQFLYHEPRHYRLYLQRRLFISDNFHQHHLLCTVHQMH